MGGVEVGGVEVLVGWSCGEDCFETLNRRTFVEESFSRRIKKRERDGKEEEGDPSPGIDGPYIGQSEEGVSPGDEG